MRAAGRIVDPVTQLVWASGRSPSALSRFVIWTRRTTSESNTHSVLTALGKTHFPKTWNRATFLSSSLDDYQKLLAAVSTGSASKLQRLSPMLTEDAYWAVERGMDESRAESGGAVQGAEIVQVLADPNIVQARSVMPPLAQASPGAVPKPTHVQICVSYKLLVRPFALALAAPAASASSAAAAVMTAAHRGGAASAVFGGRGAGVGAATAAGARAGSMSAAAGAASRRSGAGGPLSADDAASSKSGSSAGGGGGGGYGVDGDVSDTSLAAQVRARGGDAWWSVLNEESGLVYWARGRGTPGYAVHALPAHSGAASSVVSSGWTASWEAPPPSQLKTRRSWRIESAGVEREPVRVPREGARGQLEEETLVRVTQHVVWERAVLPPGTLAERAGSSPATARWRIASL